MELLYKSFDFYSMSNNSMVNIFDKCCCIQWWPRYNAALVSKDDFLRLAGA